MSDPLEAAMAASGIVPDEENVQESSELEMSSSPQTSDILNHKISDILKQAELLKPDISKTKVLLSPKIFRKKRKSGLQLQNSEIFKQAYPQKLILKPQKQYSKGLKPQIPQTITLNPDIFKSQTINPKTAQVLKKVSLKRPNMESQGPPEKRVLLTAEAFGMSVGILDKLFNQALDPKEVFIVQVDYRF